MAWSASGVFCKYIMDVLENTTAIDLNTDSLLEAALYDNSITPDKTVTTAAATAYGGGVWTTGAANVVDTGASAPAGWPALGRPLVVTDTQTTNVFKFTSANTASANATTTLAAVFGCLVYDHSIASPVADQGICFTYFGGTNSVTNGTFTIVWSASGIFTVTV